MPHAPSHCMEEASLTMYTQNTSMAMFLFKNADVYICVRPRSKGVLGSRDLGLAHGDEFTIFAPSSEDVRILRMNFGQLFDSSSVPTPSVSSTIIGSAIIF